MPAPTPGTLAVMATVFSSFKLLYGAVVNGLRGGLNLGEEQNCGAVKVLVPPQLVFNCRPEDSMPRLGRVEASGNARLQCLVVVSIGIAAQSIELL